MIRRGHCFDLLLVYFGVCLFRQVPEAFFGDHLPPHGELVFGLSNPSPLPRPGCRTALDVRMDDTWYDLSGWRKAHPAGEHWPFGTTDGRFARRVSFSLTMSNEFLSAS